MDSYIYFSKTKVTSFKITGVTIYWPRYPGNTGGRGHVVCGRLRGPTSFLRFRISVFFCADFVLRKAFFTLWGRWLKWFGFRPLVGEVLLKMSYTQRSKPYSKREMSPGTETCCVFAEAKPLITQPQNKYLLSA